MSDLTRRSFLRLFSGALATLPVLAGGQVLAPRPAIADDQKDDEAPGGLESNWVIIDVVAPYEVGVVVYDVTKVTYDKSGLPVYEGAYLSGAKVKVTSRYNGKAKEVTTAASGDSKGVANLDIRHLAINDEGVDVDEKTLDEYVFNGTIEVTLAGYRPFRTLLERVEGGSGLMVPTQPLETLKAYPYCVGFDGWDALYCNNEFVSTTANTQDHTIEAVVNLTRPDEVRDADLSLELWVSGERSARMTSGAKVANGQATASFKGPFLKLGSGSDLPAGGTFQLRLVPAGSGSGTASDYDLTWPLNFAVSLAPDDSLGAPADKAGQTLTPINLQGSSGLDFNVSGIPLISGPSKFWIPELPIGIYLNPFGLVQISIKSPSWGYLNDRGASDKNGWGTYPRKTVEQQWQKKVATAKSMSEKTTAAFSRNGNVSQIDLFTSISAMVNLELLAVAKWDSEKGLFQGEIGGRGTLSINFTITENFFAGPIPVLITFALDANFSVGLFAAAYCTRKDKKQLLLETAFDFSRWQWDYADTGFNFTMNICPSLSCGIGIRGIASISIKGAISFTMFLGVGIAGSQGDRPNPHLRAGWEAVISLVLEFFIFTKSFTLYDTGYLPIYDNWNLSAQAAGVAANLLAAKSADDLLDEMVIVSEGMLEKTGEARLSGSFAPQGDAETPSWDDLRREVTYTTEDGARVTSYAYDVADALSRKTYGADGTYGKDSALRPTEQAVPVGLGPAGEPSQAPEVEWLGSMAGDLSGDVGVACLGAEGGVRPSNDVRLFGTDVSHVFGDPRIKIFSVPGRGQQRATILFRIASVEVNGSMRTRVVGTVIDGSGKGRAGVVEFDTRGTGAGVDHDRLYDYDFDVQVGSYTDGQSLSMVVLSGERKAGDGTSLASAATDLVMTYIVFAISWEENPDGLPLQAYTWTGGGSTVSWKVSDLFPDARDTFHMVSGIQCTYWGRLYHGGLAFVTFLDRSGKTMREALGDAASVAVRMVSIGLYYNGDYEMYFVEKVVGTNYDHVLDSAVYEHVMYPEVGGRHLLMMRGANVCHYHLVKVMDDGSLGQISICEDQEPGIRLVYWPNRSDGYHYLVSCPKDGSLGLRGAGPGGTGDWTLHAATWSDDETPRLKVRPVGPSGFNVVNFAVNPRGNFIFWPHTRAVSNDRVWDTRRVDGRDQEVEDVVERPALHQVMACRMRGDTFSDPFVVADLENDTDQLTAIATTARAAVEMMRTSLVDTGERDGEGNPLYHAADIWYTSVPDVRCVTAIGCATENAIVAPGAKMEFEVAVRNDGNTYLRGCTLTLCVHDERTDAYSRVEGSSASVTFADALQPSTYNPDDGSGNLKNTEPDRSLAPGKSAVYKVEVDIPKDWEGAKKVLFVASDGQLTEDYGVQSAQSAMSAQAEPAGEAVEFHVEPGEYKVVQTRTHPDDDLERRHMHTLYMRSVAYGAASPSEGAASPTSDQNANGGEDTPGGHTPDAGVGQPVATGRLSASPAFGYLRANPSLPLAAHDPRLPDRSWSQTSSGEAGAQAGGSAPAPTSQVLPTTASGVSTQTGATAQTGGPAQSVGAGAQTSGVVGTSVTSGQPSPDTGDPSPSGVVGAGLAALGAAVLAYERRRARHEDE